MVATLSIADHNAGRTYTLIRRVIAAACPACLRALQDDLIQKAMLRITCAFEKDQTRTLNRTYLRQVARTVLLDEIRRQRHRKRVLADTDHVERSGCERAVDPERAAHTRQVLDAAMRLLDERLSEHRAEAVLHHLRGRSVREIADRMDIAPKSAENLVYRGLKDLRDGLRELGLTLG
tara:strand:- start:26 stop:559 length:534 start_codon:yes stop_codon:yes gene_type:complete